MKVLLINPPTYLNNPKGKRKPDTFPLGILYIARVLINDGHDVDLFDILAEDLSPTQVKSKLEEYKKNNYDVVGITGMSVQYRYLKYLSEQIKEIFGDITIITGGACATYSSDVLLKNAEIDIAVIGEGEITVLELLSSHSLTDVKGISFKKGDEISSTPSRDLIKNLDTIPFPAYELLNFEPYNITMQYKHEFPDSGESKHLKWVSVCSARGCPYSCNFCSKCFPGVRLRSIDNIKEEIIYLKKFTDFNYVVFTDELPLINEKRSLEIADMMSSLGLYWSASARINILNKAMLKELKKSGCVSLSIGVETGSQKLLNAMNKKIKVEDTKRVLTEICEIGIIPSVQLIFGYPGEDDETIEETYKLFRGLPITNAGFYILTPLPGSKVYEDVLNKGLINDEDVYLSNLEAGTSVVHLNLTGWSDTELIEKKILLEKRLYYNGLLARFGREYITNNVGLETLEKIIGKENVIKLLA